MFPFFQKARRENQVIGQHLCKKLRGRRAETQERTNKERERGREREIE